MYTFLCQTKCILWNFFFTRKKKKLYETNKHIQLVFKFAIIAGMESDSSINWPKTCSHWARPIRQSLLLSPERTSSHHFIRNQRKPKSEDPDLEWITFASCSTTVFCLLIFPSSLLPPLYWILSLPLSLPVVLSGFNVCALTLSWPPHSLMFVCFCCLK